MYQPRCSRILRTKTRWAGRGPMFRNTIYGTRFIVRMAITLLLFECMGASIASESWAQDGEGRVEGVVVGKDSEGKTGSIPCVKVVWAGTAALGPTDEERGQS